MYYFVFSSVLLLSSAVYVSSAPFTWSLCSSSSSPVKIMQLNVTQDKENSLLVTARSKLAVNLTSPIEGKLLMERKMFWGWTKMPCIEGYGSCNFEDVCKLSPYRPDADCPEEFKTNDLPCQCPILQGTYSAKRFPISLNGLPKFLEAGRYRLRATLSSEKQEIICLSLDITVT